MSTQNGSDKHFKVTVVWGTDAVRVLEDEPTIEKLDELGQYATREFHTKAEADAYEMGVMDTEGWIEAATYRGTIEEMFNG